MFIGHFSVGLIAKKFAPKVNLGISIFACQMLDLLCPVLLLTGLERIRIDPMATAHTPIIFEHYPYSHSLVMALIYSLLVAIIIAVIYKSKLSGVILGFVVLSHWILDFVCHQPDMPLWFNGPKVGLGLWNSKFLTVLVELFMFLIGTTMYWKTNQRLTRKQKFAFWGLISFLMFLFVGNIFGSKPEAGTPTTVIAWSGIAMWLLVFWGYMIDRK